MGVCMGLCVCVSECMWERKRGRECGKVSERERDSHQTSTTLHHQCATNKKLKVCARFKEREKEREREEREKIKTQEMDPLSLSLSLSLSHTIKLSVRIPRLVQSKEKETVFVCEHVCAGKCVCGCSCKCVYVCVCMCVCVCVCERNTKHTETTKKKL